MIQQMSESNAWSRLHEDWEVRWIKPSSKNEFGEPPFPHAFVVTRSESLQLLMVANVSEEQMVKELVGLLQAVSAGLLDDLEHDIPPAQWMDTNVDD
jgi:hypothetical protein